MKPENAKKLWNGLEAFLRHHGALMQYKENVSSYKSKTPIDFFTEEISDYRIRYGYHTSIISSSFIFNNTPQGIEFWIRLDNIWDKLTLKEFNAFLSANKGQIIHKSKIQW